MAANPWVARACASRGRDCLGGSIELSRSEVRPRKGVHRVDVTARVRCAFGELHGFLALHVALREEPRERRRLRFFLWPAFALETFRIGVGALRRRGVADGGRDN